MCCCYYNKTYSVKSFLIVIAFRIADLLTKLIAEFFAQAHRKIFSTKSFCVSRAHNFFLLV